MGVEHPLGIARGAGGVAEPGGRILVEAAPLGVGRMRLDQGLEAERPLQVDLGHVVLVGQDDEGLHRRHLVAIFHQHRQEGQVGEDDPVFGVIDDVAELVGEEARVERMAHRPDAHDRVPGLHVPAGVPGQGRDPVAGLHAHGQERVGDAPRPLLQLGIGRPHDRTFHRPRHHFAAAMPLGGVGQEPVDRQRPVLHQPEHGRSP